MKPAERAAGRNVLQLGDSFAAGILGGLPYAAQPGELGEGGSVSCDMRAAAAPADDAALRLRLSTATTPPVEISTGLVALEPARIAVRPRPWPPPAVTIGLAALPQPWTPTDGAAEQLRAGNDERDLVNWGLAAEPFAGAASWDDVLERCQRARFVVLARVGFADDLSLARTILGLCASGIPCAVRPGGAPLRWIDPALAADLSFDPDLVTDDVEWAAIAAHQKRHAWLAHDLRLSWSEDATAWRPGIAPRPLPSTSVVLTSRRPDLVPAALHQIHHQQGPEREVVVVLHGNGDETAAAAVAGSLRDLGLEGTVVRVPANVPFGAALNVGISRAHGDLVTKWDDDDLYGPHHLQDLIVGMRSVDAHLVGKAREFVYLEDEDETIHRDGPGAENESPFIAGGTLMTARSVVNDVGGFPPVHRAVDYFMIRRYLGNGLRVFRTHGFGFALSRRREGHTWDVDPGWLRSGAHQTWRGIPAVADLGRRS